MVNRISGAVYSNYPNLFTRLGIYIYIYIYAGITLFQQV